MSTPLKGERCEPHGLAVGPDGLCTLCRKEGRRSLRPPPPEVQKKTRGLWMAVAAVVVVLVGGGLAYGIASREEAPRAEAQPVEETTPEPTPGPAPSKTPREGAGDDGDSTDPRRAALAEITERAAERREALAEARSQVRIHMYSEPDCDDCDRARTWLRTHGFTFREHDVDASEAAAAELEDKNPSGSVPTFDIDGTIIRGFTEGGLDGAIDHAAQQRMPEE